VPPGSTAEILPAAQLQSFVYEGSEPIQECDEAGVTTNYARDSSGCLVSRRVGLRRGISYYYHHDATGSVTGLSDSTSRMTDSYSYDAPRLSLYEGSPMARVRQYAIMLGSAESMRTGLAAVEVVET
jgi:hypothetical protein